jgi:hypothetical protein
VSSAVSSNPATSVASAGGAASASQSALTRYAESGYIVVFWSSAAANSPYVAHEIERAARTIRGLNDRLLFACLDPTPVPAFWMQFQEPAVQLFSDADRSQKQRLDDLIVRLYWLIHRKTTEVK